MPIIEKLTNSIYLTWGAILFAAGGAWVTAGYLNDIKVQIVEVGHKVEVANIKLDDHAGAIDRLTKTQDVFTIKINDMSLQEHDTAAAVTRMQKTLDKP